MRRLRGNPLRFASSTPDYAIAIELSLTPHQGYYDCLYMALAQRLAAPLITADGKLVAKVRQAGLAIDINRIGEFRFQTA